MDRSIELKLERLRKKGKSKVVFGWIIAILMAMALIGSLDVVEEDLATRLLTYAIEFGLLFLGVRMILSGRKPVKIVPLYGEYRRIFFKSRSALDLDYGQMAQKMQRPEADVKKEVAFFIKNRLWESIYGGTEAVENREAEIAMREAKLNRTLTCDDCGGVTTVHAHAISPKCIYCGSSLGEEIMA